MKLRCIKLRNFRCFGEDEKKIDLNDLTTFVGINSCGKTTVLIALTKLFGTSANVRSLERSDFHLPIGKRPEDFSKQDLSIEAIIEFPELENSGDISKKTIPPFFDHMQICEPNGKPFVRIRLEGSWTSGNSPEGIIEQKNYFILAPEPDKISDENKKPANSTDLSHIEVIYVPAVRNPSTQLSNASGSILWRVLNGINWPEDTDSKIKTFSNELDIQLGEVGGFNELRNVLLSEWQKLHSDIRYTNVRIGFSAEDLSSLLNKIDVSFSPTEIPGSYKVDELGEGLRSLFYLSLVSSLLALENKAVQEVFSKVNDQRTYLFNNKFDPPQLTILAVEEPENHIAPYLIGRVMSIMKSLATRENAQVLVTSHSPSIVKRIDPESIRYLRISHQEQITLVSSITLPERTDEKFKFVKEAVIAYPELYFARLVVLGEGDSEELIIPKAMQLISSSLDGSVVSVVPLGGRFVNYFWKLLKDLDIPYITLLDLDFGRETGGWAKIKYVINQLIQNGISIDEILNKLIDNKVIIKRNEFNTLHKRTGYREEIMSAIKVLEGYNIFFASPLDLDFLMLNEFPRAYKETKKERGGAGPRIPNKNTNRSGYLEKVDKAIKATLKSEKANGKFFSETEQELMIWYKYLFLERGKPGTHLLALSKITDPDFCKKLPITIGKMVDKIKTLLDNDPYSKMIP